MGPLNQDTVWKAEARVCKSEKLHSLWDRHYARRVQQSSIVLASTPYLCKHVLSDRVKCGIVMIIHPVTELARRHHLFWDFVDEERSEKRATCELQPPETFAVNFHRNFELSLTEDLCCFISVWSETSFGL